MHLSKVDIFQASIIGLILAACAVVIPVMTQTPTSHQQVTQAEASAPQ